MFNLYGINNGKYIIGQMSINDNDCICVLFNTDMNKDHINKPSWWDRDKNGSIIVERNRSK